jgi:DMSO/TMAO reductase YedYZ molybdopterin-dependent catalytic subunit
VPVNRTAHAAAVLDRLSDWRLTVAGPTSARVFDRAALARLPQVTVDLPIACVEGWSVSASWSGVRVSELLRLVDAAGHDVRVVSLEQRSPYGVTRLPQEFIADPRTILATSLNGEELDPDHGYPARIIAPNRPGVLQTKWVERIEVR